MLSLDHKLTQDQTKAHHQRLVLKTVYRAGPCSRADLARATGLTRTTSSAVVDELLAAGLVMEIGQGPSAGGKPPTLLSLVEDARAVIGVDLAGQELRGAVFDLRGRPLCTLSAPRRNGLEVGEILALIGRLSEAAQGRPLLGAGIGLPGLIDLQTGLVQQAVPSGWQELALAEALRRQLAVPVALVNDSQAAALAQAVFGGVEANSLAVVRAGKGISAGIVLEGRVFQGAGYAGASEIGHVRAVEDGDLCVCGRFGCLETVASEQALLRWARTAFGNDPASGLHELVDDAERLDLAAVAAAYRQHDPAIGQMVGRTARYLGAAIAHLAAAFNLPLVILAGSLAQLGPDFAAAVQTEARQRMLPPLAALTQLRLSALGDDDVMLGAAALVLANELGVV